MQSVEHFSLPCSPQNMDQLMTLRVRSLTHL